MTVKKYVETKQPKKLRDITYKELQVESDNVLKLMEDFRYSLIVGVDILSKETVETLGDKLKKLYKQYNELNKLCNK